MSYFYNKKTKSIEKDPKFLVAENSNGDKIRITRPEYFSFDSADLDWIKLNDPPEEGEFRFNDETYSFDMIIDSAPESELFLNDEDPDTLEQRV